MSRGLEEESEELFVDLSVYFDITEDGRSVKEKCEEGCCARHCTPSLAQLALEHVREGWSYIESHEKRA